VHSHDRDAAAKFLADILGLRAPRPFGPLMGVEVDNEVTLDFIDAAGEVSVQHYAFLISESEFDAIFTRIRERRLAYWSDPGRTRPNEINTFGGGRRIYFQDPSGHLLEIMTQA
jgi:catechol 2,3-dioxygenase-like lactoylglutathione lyase family enzyme